MLRVGLTGGLACGKTFVSRELERLGCHIVNADTLGHEVLLPDGEAYEPVVRLFGREILDGNGAIQRPRLAALVFHAPEKLAALNALVHPAVRRRGDTLVEAIRREDPGAIVVVEAAILIETGIYKDFDKLIVVLCSEKRQMERALTRDPKAEPADIEARIARQLPLETKRKYADFIVDTSGTEEDTRRQTRDVFSALQKEALTK